MAALLIKNIPPRLHALLKQRAATHRRSLNSEAIHVLEEAIARDPAPAAFPPPPAPSPEFVPPGLPPEIAARLRALQFLGDSLAAREVDFDQWRDTILDSRR